jgi:hypothetical protein
MLGAMRWPWSSRTDTNERKSPALDLLTWPELPDSPASDEAMRNYYKHVATRLFDRGTTFLDRAANQRTPEWTSALTGIGSAYFQASVTLLTIGEQFGYLRSQPADPGLPNQT